MFLSKSVPRDGLGAFTMLEMLLVLALIGLLSTVAIKGVSGMLSSAPPTPKEVVAQMLAASRRYALSNECTVRMSYSDEKHALEAAADDGTELPEMPLPTGASVQFLPVQTTDASGGASGSVFDAVAGSGASADLPYITFYADGTCSMVKVSVQAAEKPPLNLAIDPWTGGQVLTRTTLN